MFLTSVECWLLATVTFDTFRCYCH